VLINPPFFDGWDFNHAIRYLCGYAGVPCSTTSSWTLSSSTDISSPRFDFKTGTTCMDAINTLCEDAGMMWVIQPNGIMEFHEIGANGLPIGSGGGGGDSSAFTMVSYDTSPDFEDLRNQIVVVGMHQAGSTARDTVSNGLPVYPIIMTQSQQTTPEFAWMRGYLYSLPGYSDIDGVQRALNHLGSVSRIAEMTGSMSGPGRSGIRLLDGFGGGIVVGITHNIDLVSKTWTTGVALGSA
jgi:hypothetical protein